MEVDTGNEIRSRRVDELTGGASILLYLVAVGSSCMFVYVDIKNALREGLCPIQGVAVRHKLSSHAGRVDGRRCGVLIERVLRSRRCGLHKPQNAPTETLHRLACFQHLAEVAIVGVGFTHEPSHIFSYPVRGVVQIVVVNLVSSVIKPLDSPLSGFGKPLQRAATPTTRSHQQYQRHQHHHHGHR